MSFEQLRQLKELSEVFSQGSANPYQIQQLSLLLAENNLNKFKSDRLMQSDYR
jgi:hypothetical protein